MSDLLQRVAVYAVLGMVLSAADIAWDHWAFLCVLALVWVSNYLARVDGLEHGVAMGIEIYTKMTPEQRAEVSKLMEEEQQ